MKHTNDNDMLINKSKAYVSQHLKLLDLPSIILEKHKSGECPSLRTTLELASLYSKEQQLVENFLENYDFSASGEITRADVENLKKPQQEEKPFDKDIINEIKQAQSEEVKNTATPFEFENVADEVDKPSHDFEEKEKNFKKPTFKVNHNGYEGRILMKKIPSEEGKVFIKMDYDGSEEEVDIEKITFLQLCEND